MANPVENLWQKNLEGLESLGEFIRNQRKFASLSQRQLARLAELSDTYMSQLERAPRALDRVLRALAQALDIDPHELIAAPPASTTTETSGRSPRSDPATCATDAQKQALLRVVESTSHAEERASGDEGGSFTCGG